ncbi:MAG: VOC family protein [Sandaracinaceae bacterium]|nr:VOC family protein [Sandaracinaceae bacterium]
MPPPYPPILDHLTVPVRDYERSKAFYAAALAPLGITLVMEHGKAGGFGKGKPELWIGEGPTSFQSPEQLRVITPIHVALRAASREEVDAFHAAALAAGGKDFGAPGLRPHYHPGYYGAFVLDPDGHDLEAVHHSFVRS